MSWLSKAAHTFGNSLKKLPGKVLSGQPIVTGVFRSVPVIGGVLGKVEQSAGLSSNSLKLVGAGSLAKQINPIEAKGGQVTAAAFGAGALVGLAKGANTVSTGQPVVEAVDQVSSGFGSGGGLGSGGFLSDVAGYAQDAAAIVQAGGAIYQQIKGGAPAPVVSGGVVSTAPAPSAHSTSGLPAYVVPLALVVIGGGIAFTLLRRK
jgi:hypothetical protein